MKINRILETCLYAKDLLSIEKFYTRVLGLELNTREVGRHLFFRCGDSMLLIFNPDHTANELTKVNGYNIPLHGSEGTGHLAFAINHTEIEDWKEHLINAGVNIESQVNWPNAATSLYFRDPTGNSLELVSPKLWKIE